MAGATLIALTGLSIGMKVYSDEMAAEETAASLRFQMAQTRLKAAEKTRIRQRQIERVISRQKAEVGMRGIDPGSATFKAIQQDSFDEFARDQKAANLTLQAQEQYFNSKIQAANQSGFLSAVGDVVSGAMGLASTTSLTKPNVVPVVNAVPSYVAPQSGAEPSAFAEIPKSTASSLLDYEGLGKYMGGTF